MTNVDMIAWFADGENSSVKDYWSIAKKAPAEDDSQDIETVFIRPMTTTGEVAFVTYRKLETGDSD